MNIQNEHVLKCLPLLASALGDKYGVRVVIAGTQAMTDGQTIYLPSMPVTCEDTFLKVVRGYIDHEAAHIRYSDFENAKHNKLTIFEKFVWNCIEDWRIEQKMGEHFTGCKANLHWLIHHIFYKKKENIKKLPLQDALNQWLLLTLRSWDRQELEPQVQTLTKYIHETMQSPQLLTELGAILLEVQAKCVSSEDVFTYTKAIVDCIERYIKQLEENASANSDSISSETLDQNNEHQGNTNTISQKPSESLEQPRTSSSTGCGEEHEAKENTKEQEENNTSNNQKSTMGESTRTTVPNTTNKSTTLQIQETIYSLRDLCNSQNSFETLGDKAKSIIEEISETTKCDNISLAVEVQKKHGEFEPDVIQFTRRISTALKARLQGLLQAQSLVRHLPARRGKINRSRLHVLASNDNRVFLQQTHKQETNSAVHILLDNSASMGKLVGTISKDMKGGELKFEKQIDIASKACYALASALESTKGINVAVTRFPAHISSEKRKKLGIPDNAICVCPLVKHGEKVHRNFNIEHEGYTPLTEALWYVLPKVLSQKEARKIILIVTDGDPNEPDAVKLAIKQAEKLGIEIYGIGIPESHVEQILPNTSVNLESIEQLPQAMFGLLQKALVQIA